MADEFILDISVQHMINFEGNLLILNFELRYLSINTFSLNLTEYELWRLKNYGTTIKFTDVVGDVVTVSHKYI